MVAFELLLFTEKADNIQPKPNPIAIDLFCGAGGLSLGAKLAEIDVCVACNNVDHAWNICWRSGQTNRLREVNQIVLMSNWLTKEADAG